MLYALAMIEAGDPLPDATLNESTEFGEACPIAPQKVSVAAATRGKRVVIFGVPGAFTPTCSERHIPGYLEHLAGLKARGVDEVWCVSVNDGYVMAAWGRDRGAIGKVRMLGDGNGELTTKLGLDVDRSSGGMGRRSLRYSLLIEDGVVKRVNVEAPGKLEVSTAEAMLKQLA